MDIYQNKNFTPMLLSETKEPFNDMDFIFELKFDGIRSLVFADSNKIIIQNKRKDNLNSRYPELLSINNNIKNKVIFDGEIIMMIDGKPSFEKLKERALLKDKLKIIHYSKNYPVVFVCYDILYENKDLTNLPLLERKKILEKYEDTHNFIKTIYIENNGIDLFKATVKNNLEGIVAKRKDSKYQINSRSKDWIKIKNLQEEDLFICGYKEEEDKAMANLLLGRIDNDKLIYAGKVTIGKKKKEYSIIKKQPKLSKNPITDINKEDYIYIKPNLKCTVNFMEKTKNNQMRQPFFKNLILEQ